MSVATPARAWASIDLSALNSNLLRARAYCPGAKVAAVIKANAYGHGVNEVAASLAALPDGPDCLAVATLDELVALQLLGTGKRLLLLGGIRSADELRFAAESGAEFVLHSDYQLALLKRWITDRPESRLSVWLKLDTGMHRLGLALDEFRDAANFLGSCKQVSRLVVMSHLASADGTDPLSETVTRKQVTRFREALAAAGAAVGRPVEASLSASAGIMGHKDLGFDCVRPGIMLYGGSPFADRHAESLGLKPVMTLSASLVAIKQVAAGETIGYGATFHCDSETRVGVVAIGYGDGYPRSLPSGTPVLVNSRGRPLRVRLLGRVSMDLITIDLSGLDDVQVGDPVVLWGRGLPVDEIAAYAGTLSYELCCRVTRRVKFDYQS